MADPRDVMPWLLDFASSPTQRRVAVDTGAGVVLLDSIRVRRALEACPSMPVARWIPGALELSWDGAGHRGRLRLRVCALRALSPMLGVALESIAWYARNGRTTCNIDRGWRPALAKAAGRAWKYCQSYKPQQWVEVIEAYRAAPFGVPIKVEVTNG